MKKSLSSNNSREKKSPLPKSRSSSRINLEPFHSFLEKNLSKSSTNPIQKLKSHLDELKFENYLKQARLSQTLEKIKSLQSCQNQEEKKNTSKASLEDINEKNDEETAALETLSHLKSSIFRKVNHWKSKISEISELFEKFSLKHDKICLTLIKALRESEKVEVKLDSFRERVKSESLERKKMLLKKRLMKEALERETKNLFDMMEGAVNQRIQKKKSFYSELERISFGSNLKYSEKNPRFQRFLKDFQIFRNFFEKLTNLKSLPEMVDFALEKVSDLKENSKSLSLKSEEITNEISKKQEQCEILRKEYESLKNPSNQKKIFENQDFFPIKSVKNEEILIKLFYSFQQISKEVSLKTGQINSNFPEAELNPLILDFNQNESHSVLHRSNTSNRIIRRKAEKHLTSPEKAQSHKHEENEPVIIKSIKNLFKEKILNEIFSSSQVIRLFSDFEYLETLSSGRYSDEQDKKDLVFSVFSKALINLTGSLFRSFNRTRSVLFYLKSQTDHQMGNKSQLVITCHQKHSKPLVPRFFIRSMSDKKSRKSRSPGQFSNSASGDLTSLSKTERLKEMREIDKKLRFIKLKFRML